MLTPSLIKSATTSSSSLAIVCWKLVMESTRVAKGICQASSVMRSSKPAISLSMLLPSSARITISKLSFLV